MRLSFEYTAHIRCTCKQGIGLHSALPQLASKVVGCRRSKQWKLCHICQQWFHGNTTQYK